MYYLGMFIMYNPVFSTMTTIALAVVVFAAGYIVGWLKARGF